MPTKIRQSVQGRRMSISTHMPRANEYRGYGAFSMRNGYCVMTNFPQVKIDRDA